jgi:hypothetical protein
MQLPMINSPQECQALHAALEQVGKGMTIYKYAIMDEL